MEKKQEGKAVFHLLEDTGLGTGNKLLINTFSRLTK